MGIDQGRFAEEISESLMALPIVSRQIARQEMDESIAWYEKERSGLGIELAAEIEIVLNRIASTPEQFQQIRGEVRQQFCAGFPTPYTF